MAIPNWLTLSQSSGSGDTIITITASPNEDTNSREYELVISGNTKSVTTKITQAPGMLVNQSLQYWSTTNDVVAVRSTFTPPISTNTYNNVGVVVFSVPVKYDGYGLGSSFFTDDSTIYQVKYPTYMGYAQTGNGNYYLGRNRTIFSYGCESVGYGYIGGTYKSAFYPSITSIKFPETMCGYGTRKPRLTGGPCNPFKGLSGLPVVDSVRYTSTTPSDNPVVAGVTQHPGSVVTLIDGTMAVAPLAFYSYNSISKIVLPSSFVHMSKGAFNTGITLQNVTSATYVMSGYTYTERSKYTSLDSNDNPCLVSAWTTVSNGTKMGQVRNCNIMEGTRVIGDGVFAPENYDYWYSDSSASEGGTFTDAILPNSVISIGNASFRECRYLSGLTLNNGLLRIGETAFSGCTGLTSISIPSTVKYISHEAFRDCRSLTSITFNEGLEYLGYLAFDGCSGLTGNIVLPSTLKYIGGNAFRGINITSATLSSAIYDNGAFKSCDTIRTLVLPANLKIGSMYFDSMSLTDIYCYATVEPKWIDYPVQGGATGVTVHIPSGSTYPDLANYTADVNWTIVADL